MAYRLAVTCPILKKQTNKNFFTSLNPTPPTEVLLALCPTTAKLLERIADVYVSNSSSPFSFEPSPSRFLRLPLQLLHQGRHDLHIVESNDQFSPQLT